MYYVSLLWYIYFHSRYVRSKLFVATGSAFFKVFSLDTGQTKCHIQQAIFAPKIESVIAFSLFFPFPPSSKSKIGGSLYYNIQYIIYYKVQTPFLKTDLLLYHKFGKMVLFRTGKLISTLQPRKPGLSENYLLFFIKKVEIGHQSSIIKNIYDYITMP